MEALIEYEITKHAKERYAERIMNRDNDVDVMRFIADNEEKIEKDINKLINYGKCVYTGKQNNKGNVVDVYIKDTWVVIVDSKKLKVVTLYKIDLGLEEEFNRTYVAKMLEKLSANKDKLETTKQKVLEESNMYRELIEDTETQIKEYRTMIKNLEELNEGYKLIIQNNSVKISQDEKEVVEVLNTLINKREF